MTTRVYIVGDVGTAPWGPLAFYDADSGKMLHVDMVHINLNVGAISTIEFQESGCAETRTAELVPSPHTQITHLSGIPHKQAIMPSKWSPAKWLDPELAMLCRLVALSEIDTPIYIVEGAKQPSKKNAVGSSFVEVGAAWIDWARVYTIIYPTWDGKIKWQWYLEDGTVFTHDHPSDGHTH